MHHVDHAQAVEAANACADCKNDCGHNVCTVVRYVRSLSAPGPSRDAATAEKCRAFVRKCFDAKATVEDEGINEDKAIDEYAAELLAMFAGGTGDDGEYNPNYGDEKICDCGHEYHRHFDSHEHMEPVSCKYCECDSFKPAPTEPAK